MKAGELQVVCGCYGRGPATNALSTTGMPDVGKRRQLPNCQSKPDAIVAREDYTLPELVIMTMQLTAIDSDMIASCNKVW